MNPNIENSPQVSINLIQSNSPLKTFDKTRFIFGLLLSLVFALVPGFSFLFLFYYQATTINGGSAFLSLIFILLTKILTTSHMFFFVIMFIFLFLNTLTILLFRKEFNLRRSLQWGYLFIIVIFLLSWSYVPINPYLYELESQNKTAVQNLANQETAPGNQGTVTQGLSNTTSSSTTLINNPVNKATVGWKTYTNTRYGFQFEFPSRFTGGPTNSDVATADAQCAKYAFSNPKFPSTPIVTMDTGGVDVSIYCIPLTKDSAQGYKSFSQFYNANVTPLMISGRNGYKIDKILSSDDIKVENMFVGNSNIQFVDEVVVVPFDATHFLLLQPDNTGWEPGYPAMMSKSEWNSFLSSFKFTTPAVDAVSTSTNKIANLVVSCKGRSDNFNTTIAWSASVSGGTGYYSYLWSNLGDESGYGNYAANGLTKDYLTVDYKSPGSKTISLQVKDGVTKVNITCTAVASKAI